MELSKNIGGKCGNKVFYFANLIDSKLLDKNTIELIFDRDIDMFVNESLSIFLGYVDTSTVDSTGLINHNAIYNVNATITNILIDPSLRKITITILEDLNDYYEDITKPNIIMKAIYNGSYDINKFEIEFFNRIPKPLIFQYTAGGALLNNQGGSVDLGTYTHYFSFNTTKIPNYEPGDTTMYDFVEEGDSFDVIPTVSIMYNTSKTNPVKIETSSTYTVVKKLFEVDGGGNNIYKIYVNLKSGDFDYQGLNIFSDFIYSSDKFIYDNTKSPANIDVKLYGGFHKTIGTATIIQYYNDTLNQDNDTSAGDIVYPTLQVGSVITLFSMLQYFKKYDDTTIYISAKSTTHTVVSKYDSTGVSTATDGNWDIDDQGFDYRYYTLYKEGVDKFTFPHYIKNTKLI